MTGANMNQMLSMMQESMQTQKNAVVKTLAKEAGKGADFNEYMKWNTAKSPEVKTAADGNTAKLQSTAKKTEPSDSEVAYNDAALENDQTAKMEGQAEDAANVTKVEEYKEPSQAVEQNKESEETVDAEQTPMEKNSDMAVQQQEEEATVLNLVSEPQTGAFKIQTAEMEEMTVSFELFQKVSGETDEVLQNIPKQEQQLQIHIQMPKETKEVVDQIVNQLVTKIAESFQVSEEEVMDAMETMAVHLLDLLQKDGLKELAVTISGEESLVSLVTKEELLQSYQRMETGIKDVLTSLPEEELAVWEKLDTVFTQAQDTVKEFMVEQKVANPEQVEQWMTQAKTEITVQPDMAEQKNVSSDVSGAIQQTAIQQTAPQQTASQQTASQQTAPQQVAMQQAAMQQTTSQQASIQPAAIQQTAPRQITPGETVEPAGQMETESSVTTAPEQDTQASSTKAQNINQQVQQISQEIVAQKEQPVENVLQKEEKVDNVRGNESTLNNSQSTDEVLSVQTKEAAANGGQENTSSEQSRNPENHVAEETKKTPVIQNTTSVTTITTENQVQTVVKTEQTSYEGIVKQIVEQVKVEFKPDTVSMELQLNPESLGKVNLHVSSKEGAVTAELFVQNETVKNAIEGQLMVLRETMQQQGIKVEAVEVTVQTGEFGRNLEQNSSEEQKRKAENQSKAYQRKGINLLQGVDEESMSEDDLLRAHIMQESGNSVDMNA